MLALLNVAVKEFSIMLSISNFFSKINLSSIRLNNIKLTSNKLNFIVVLFFTLVINSKIWSIYFESNDISSLYDFFQMVCFGLFMYFLLLALSTLFNYPYVQKIALILLTLISVPAMYFSLTYGAQFDVTMLQNLLETDPAEAADLINPSFLMVIIVVGCIPAYLIYKIKSTYQTFFKQLINNILQLVLYFVLSFASAYAYYAELSSFVRNGEPQISNSLLPTALVYSTYKNLIAHHLESKIEKKLLDPNAKILNIEKTEGDKPLVVVVVIGETAREVSFSQKDEGMENVKETLIGRKDSLYFSNFWSCGTNTALSVPCMFSIYSKEEYKRSMNKEFENVAELISRVGYDVVWRNNNSGCKGICNQLIKDPITLENSKAFHNDGVFYDQALVEDLAERISKKSTDQVLFLHQLGSHGPTYFKRVPKRHKVLQPACESADFSQCENIEIVNAYNNSVLYTKYTLNNAINSLEKLQDDYNILLLYMSDHGESTGKNGMYLHGIPYFMAPDEQTHIPAFIWVSKGFAAQKGIDMQCMKDKQQQRLSHDNLSHTLLGLLNIDTTVYSKSLDLFNGCIQSKSILN